MAAGVAYSGSTFSSLSPRGSAASAVVASIAAPSIFTSGSLHGSATTPRPTCTAFSCPPHFSGSAQKFLVFHVLLLQFLPPYLFFGCLLTLGSRLLLFAASFCSRSLFSTASCSQRICSSKSSCAIASCMARNHDVVLILWTRVVVLSGSGLCNTMESCDGRGCWRTCVNSYSVRRRSRLRCAYSWYTCAEKHCEVSKVSEVTKPLSMVRTHVRTTV